MESDDEAPVKELCEIWSTASLALLPGLLWSEVVAPDSDPSKSQVELLAISYTWNHLTIRKQMINIKLNY